MADKNEHREEAGRKVEAATTGAREAKDSPDVAGADNSARAPRRAPRAAAPDDDKYSVDSWGQFARQAFGVPAYVLKAVAADDDRTEYSKSELEELVKNFLGRPAE
jgi:hypothetical protein